MRRPVHSSRCSARSLAPVPDRTSVLVAADNPMLRAGMAAAVHDAPCLALTGRVSDAGAVVREAERNPPDVVLLAGRCRSALTRLGERVDPPKVVVLAEPGRDLDVRAALGAGAAGLLPVSVPPRRLVAAVRAVAAGDLVLAPDVAGPLTSLRRADPAEVLRMLTPREAEVVRLVGLALSNAEIARALRLGESTVKTHLNRAMAKLGLSRRSQVVALAYEKGLVDPASG